MDLNEAPSRHVKNDQATLRDVSFDELLDDTVGFSFKSVRSIWVLFEKPRHYFEAAKAPFWHNRFSPSFRIYAGLVALSTGMKFLYRDENSPMVKVYQEVFETIKAQLIDDGKLEGAEIDAFDTTAIAVTTLKWYMLVSPFIMFMTFTILGLLYFGYGEKLNPIVRIRYIFAMIIPASVIGFLSIFPTYYAPSQLLQLLSFMGMGLMFAMIWITAYRGAFENVPTKGGRAGRASAISLLAILCTFVSACIAVIIAVVIAVRTTLS